MEPVRADDVFQGRPVLEKILEGIEESCVVVADLTGRNANVFYELGIAHVRKDRVVLIPQEIVDVPFDLQHMELLQYDDSRAGRKALATKLAQVLRRFAGDEDDVSVADNVQVLRWSKSHAGLGAGLIVHNISAEVALSIQGQRVMPTGAFEVSDELKTLGPGERDNIGSGWRAAERPNDAPSTAPVSQYITRVLWSDRYGGRHVGRWTLTDKLG